MRVTSEVLRVIAYMTHTNSSLHTTRDSEWQALLSAAVDGIVVIDSEGGIEVFNPAAEKMFGYSAVEVLGKNVSVLMAEHDAHHHDQYMQSYQQGGQARIIGIGREVVAKTKSGHEFPADLSVGVIHDQGPRRYVGIIRDVTDKKLALAEIKKEHELTQQYLDLAQVLIVQLDLEGYIVTINQRGQELLGCRQEELVGQNWFDVCVPESLRPISRQRVSHILENPNAEVSAQESWVVSKTGEERLIAWRSVAIFDDNGDVIGSMHSGLDLTERRKTEQEMSQARERLSQFGRLSTIGEMAAGLAHEINQPLTAIAGYTQACQRLIQAGKTDPAHLLETAQKINTQAMRAGEVIKRLRRFVKPSNTGRSTIDCEKLVRDVVELAELDAKAHRTQLRIETMVPGVLVTADEVQIQQVVLNLIRNAIDAMVDTPQADRVVRIQMVKTMDSRVRITVIDRGTGVSPEAQSRLFDPFYTTKKGGMGLGLPMCRSIIDAHGGVLRFEPAEESGASFYFELPTNDSE